LGLEIGDVSDVLVRLFDGYGFWELHRFIDVSWSGYGTSFWIKIRKKIVRGCEFKLGGFFVARNDGRTKVSRINVTAIFQSITEFFRATVHRAEWTALAEFVPWLETKFSHVSLTVFDKACR
jgi:hypothetical protein